MALDSPAYRLSSLGRLAVYRQIGENPQYAHSFGARLALGSEGVKQICPSVWRGQLVVPEVCTGGCYVFSGFAQPNESFRSSSANPAEQRSVADSFDKPVLWGFTVFAVSHKCPR
jgi:hypothetical protein